MNKSEHYQTDHIIAKALVCLAVIALGAISIEISNPYVALVPGTVIWFFGVNAAAYLFETLSHHEHRHSKF